MADKREVVCSPLCAASKAYGRFDKPWLHELECPVRIAWENERASSDESGPVSHEEER